MKDSKLIIIYLIIGLIIFTCTITVAFSAFTTELKIAGEATFRVITDIRIVGVELMEATNGALIEYDAKYNTTELMTGFSLPYLNSTITYNITINNIGNAKMKLKEIIENSMSNENIVYEIDGIQLNDIIEPSNTTKTFLVTFKYKEGLEELPSDNILNSRIAFNFVELAEIKLGDYIYVDPAYNLKAKNGETAEEQSIKEILNLKWKIHNINENGTIDLVSVASDENSEYTDLIMHLGNEFKIEACEGENTSTNMHILVKK